MALPEFLFGLVVLFGAMIATTFHQVHEGYIAVYYRGGAILDSISEPGWHVMMPFLTTFHEVQVTVQTDKVNNVPCGTAGGVMIQF